MAKKGIWAAISYTASAVALVMFNKAALSSYNFPCADIMTLSQIICSSCFLYVLVRFNLITFSSKESNGSKLLVPVRTLFNTLPISLTYLLYMQTSMEAVRVVNVPMYTSLRRTTIVLTMLLEYVLMRQRYTRRVIGSVALIVVGAMIAGARDLSFDPYGYSVVFGANIAMAINLTCIARSGKSSGLNTFGLMWCNGLACIPILLAWTFFRGDWEKTMRFPYLMTPSFLIVMLSSCWLVFLLNYTTFLNTTSNSALTHTICSNLKDAFTIGLGWAIFGGLSYDLWNVIGQLVGWIGAATYAYLNLVGQ